MPSRRVPSRLSPNRLSRILEERRREGRPILDLTNTNPTRAGLPDPPRDVIDALADPRALRYDPDPRGIAPAREAVAAYLSARAGAAVPPERVFLTASTSEAYAHLFRLLCDPGDEVVAPRPSYPLIEPLARVEGVRVVTYRLTYDGRWGLDLDSLEGAVGPRTRAVVVVQPNNPTGSCLDPGEIARVEALCAASGLALIADEVFGDFPWPPRIAPLPGLWGGRRMPTFVLGGVSKACGLPQMKAGWIAADGPDAALTSLLPALDWILDLFLSVGAPVMWALPRLLDSRGSFQSALRDRLRSNLDVLRAAAARAPGALELWNAEGGWSAVVRLHPAGVPSAGLHPAGPGPDVGEDLAEWALRRHDVHLHPGHFYELGRDDLVVVSLLTEPDRLREALARLAGA
jgi:hypothetical protein